MLKQCSYGVTNAHALIWAGGYFKAQWHPKQNWSKLLHLPDFNAFSFILHMLVAENCRCMLVQDKIEVQRVCCSKYMKRRKRGASISAKNSCEVERGKSFSWRDASVKMLFPGASLHILSYMPVYIWQSLQFLCFCIPRNLLSIAYLGISNVKRTASLHLKHGCDDAEASMQC